MNEITQLIVSYGCHVVFYGVVFSICFYNTAQSLRFVQTMHSRVYIHYSKFPQLISNEVPAGIPSYEETLMSTTSPLITINSTTITPPKSNARRRQIQRTALLRFSRGPCLLGTVRVPQEWGESRQYSAPKPLPSLGSPWMP